MTDHELGISWKQHFPTYTFKERDIALEEYKTAAKNLESEERVFLNASNIALIVAAGLGSLAVGSLDSLTKTFSKVMPQELTLAVLIFLTGGFSIVTLRYFADRQKSVVFAARKLIVLRRMLGLSYGTLQLVLPNWRVEGADEPLAIRLFPGWNTYVTYPFYAISGISSAVLFFVLIALAKVLLQRNWVFPLSAPFYVICLVLGWWLLLTYIYRKALLDTHERPLLLFVKELARTLRLRLVGNFEYVIYRAMLARCEIDRLKVNLTCLKRKLIFIEDRTFYKHPGVSIRGIVRALLGLVGMKRRSGGSTITQQLVRTLFIEEPTKLIRRKIIEILLAFWFDRVFAKEDQLELYLACVKFEKGVFGVLAAMRYFFGEIKGKPSAAESFFLIERVSNVHSSLLAGKIDQTLNATINQKMMSIEDARETIALYRNSIDTQKIKDPTGSGIAKLQLSLEPSNPASKWTR